MRSEARRGLLVVGTAILLAAVAVAGVSRAYGGGPTSESDLLITGLPQSATQDNAYSASQYVTQRMLTYVSVATSDQVLNQAARRLGETSGDLTGAVTATVPLDTSVLQVAVTGSTPVQAQTRALAIDDALQTAIVQLESPDGTSPRVSVAVLSDPSLPTPSGLPSTPLAALLGALLGAVVGFVLDLVIRARFGRSGQLGLATRQRRHRAGAAGPPAIAASLNGKGNHVTPADLRERSG